MYEGEFYVDKEGKISPEVAKEIQEWVDGGKTAICPKCDMDSVIGESSGFPITKEFLGAMYKKWFS